MAININKKSLLSVLDILACVKTDSSPESNSIYLDFKKDQLLLTKGNRHSKVNATFNIEYSGVESGLAILFDDFVKIVKNCEDDFSMNIEKNKIKFYGGTYQYSVQSMKFGLEEVLKRKFEGKKLFTITNDELVEYKNHLVVSPLKRNPPVLDSIIISNGHIYSVDHVIMSRMDLDKEFVIENQELLRPIPVQVLDIANKLSPDCIIDVFGNDRQICLNFKISDIVFVSVSCSYFEGIAPMEIVSNIFDGLDCKIGTYFVPNDKLSSSLKRMKAVSDADSNFVKMSVNDLVLTFTKELSEKSVSSAVGFKAAENSSVNHEIKFNVDHLITALKHMDDDIAIGLTDKFIVVYDASVTHVIPSST